MTDRSEARRTTWLLFAIVVSARAYRSSLLTLTAVAILPTVIGWQTFMVSTGSMDPAVSVGDVVVAKPVRPDDEIAVGRIYAFTDLSSDPVRILVHRVVGTADDLFVTQGDANATPDSTHVAADQFQARGAILAPWVGLPVVWFQQGKWGHLALFLTFSALAFWVALRNLDDEPPRHGLPRLISTVRHHLRRRNRGNAPPERDTAALRLAAWPALAILALIAGWTGPVRATPPKIAEAGFTATSESAGNSWTFSVPSPRRPTEDGPGHAAHTGALQGEAQGMSSPDGN